MPESIPTFTKARSEYANGVRTGADNLTELRQRLAAAKLDKMIRATVAEAPPLSDEQARHLARLLYPVSGVK